MRQFDYVSTDNLDATVDLLQRHTSNGQNGDGIRLLAGGTDLLTLMKADIATPASLVDIKRTADIPEGIEQSDDGLTLGALTTLSDIETNPVIRRSYPVLAQAVSLAATPQLRNRATLGGNLLQRPRCWYFRNALFNCWLKGGDECQAQDGRNQFHALFANQPCCAVHPSDLAPALLALDASVWLRGPDGERTLPLADFFALPEDDRRQETVIRNDEVLLSVYIPAQPATGRSAYLKAMDRKVWAFALVSAAIVLNIEQGRVSQARLVLGGVAPIPWRVQTAEEQLIGYEPSADHFAQAAAQAVAGAQPLQENGYKLPLIQSLIRKLPDALAAQNERP